MVEQMGCSPRILETFRSKCMYLFYRCAKPDSPENEFSDLFQPKRCSECEDKNDLKERGAWVMLERKLNHLDSFSGGSPPIPWNTESIKLGWKVSLLCVWRYSNLGRMVGYFPVARFAQSIWGAISYGGYIAALSLVAVLYDTLSCLL